MSLELSEKAGKATIGLRTALVAECAGRAYPVYQNTWEGAFADAVARSIAIGWDFALGLPIDRSEVASVLAEVDQHIDFYLDDGNDLPGTYCVLVKRVLECLSEEAGASDRAFRTGLSTYIDVAKFAEAAANSAHSEQPPKKVAVVQEKEWQESAVALLAAWQGPATREMFAGLGPNQPAWVGDWLARRG